MGASELKTSKINGGLAIITPTPTISFDHFGLSTFCCDFGWDR